MAHKISLAGATVAVYDLVLDARRMRGVVYFQVLDPQRAEVMIEDLEHQLRAALRRLVADAALPEGADARRQWVKQSLNAQLRERGLLVARVDLAPLA